MRTSLDLLTPDNFPELRVAAERYRSEVKAAKAAGYDRATLRMAIKRAGAAYLAVFGEVARR
jgi:hypothetical protein